MKKGRGPRDIETPRQMRLHYTERAALRHMCPHSTTTSPRDVKEDGGWSAIGPSRAPRQQRVVYRKGT